MFFALSNRSCQTVSFLRCQFWICRVQMTKLFRCSAFLDPSKCPAITSPFWRWQLFSCNLVEGLNLCGWKPEWEFQINVRSLSLTNTSCQPFRSSPWKAWWMKCAFTMTRRMPKKNFWTDCPVGGSKDVRTCVHLWGSTEPPNQKKFKPTWPRKAWIKWSDCLTTWPETRRIKNQKQIKVKKTSLFRKS